MRIVNLLVAVFALGSALAWGQAPSPEEVLVRAEERGLFGIETPTFHAAFSIQVMRSEGTEDLYAFRVWAKEFPDGTVKSLIVYDAPELMAGTAFLTHSPPEGDPRIWMYLPALGVVRELVGQEAEGGEFLPGTGITYHEVAAGFTYREEYQPESLVEEILEGEPAYLLRLIPSQPETRWSEIHLWVHQEEFVVLRAEYYGETGDLQRLLQVGELVEDELGVRPQSLIIEDLAKGSRAVIHIQARSAPEIPDEYFLPENLPSLELGSQ
jgi:hypothetical protein